MTDVSQESDNDRMQKHTFFDQDQEFSFQQQ